MNAVKLIFALGLAPPIVEKTDTSSTINGEPAIVGSAGFPHCTIITLPPVVPSRVITVP